METIEIDWNQTQVHIIADGNCLFRCFSHLLYNRQDRYFLMRQLIVRTVTNNWDHFHPFIAGKAGSAYGQWIPMETPEDYAAHMGSDNVHGTDIEIYAFTFIYKNVRVGTYQAESQTVTYLGKSEASVLLLLRLFGSEQTGYYDIVYCNSHDDTFAADSIAAEQKKRKHAAYSRRYRQKKQREVSEKTVEDNHELTQEEINRVLARRKKAAEYTRMYRKRKKDQENMKRGVIAENSQDEVRVKEEGEVNIETYLIADGQTISFESAAGKDLLQGGLIYLPQIQEKPTQEEYVTTDIYLPGIQNENAETNGEQLEQYIYLPETQPAVLENGQLPEEYIAADMYLPEAQPYVIENEVEVANEQPGYAAAEVYLPETQSGEIEIVEEAESVERENGEIADTQSDVYGSQISNKQS